MYALFVADIEQHKLPFIIKQHVFSHTPVLCSLSGAGGWEDELAARSGSGLLVFSAAAGTGVVFLSTRRSEGGSAPGSGADYPLGGGGAWI